MKVELHTQDEVVGEITLGEDGICLGSNAVATSLMADLSIVEVGGRRGAPARLTPRDGERYLRALPINVSGSYFWATLIED